MKTAHIQSCGKLLDLSYVEEGSGDPVLLIHGFASTKEVNWVQPGWLKALSAAGFYAIAHDNRGHGHSTKFHDPADYALECMVGDAVALLDHLAIEKANLVGYSMGARICAAIALAAPERVRRMVLSGNGWNMVEPTMDWSPVRDALLADDPATVTDPQGIVFRAFADRTRSDRKALAACVTGVRFAFSQENIASIRVPFLVAVGSKDDVGGSPQRLAALNPLANSFVIEGRDHMKAVGDSTHIAAVIEFLKKR